MKLKNKSKGFLILKVTFALFYLNTVYGQDNLIYNSSFEDGHENAVPQCDYYSNVFAPTGREAFESDIKNWKVADKQFCCFPGLCSSPDWYGLNCSGSGFGNPPTGERWLHLWGASDCRNEIVRQTMKTELQSGKIYTLRMKLMGLAGGNNHIRVHFTENDKDWYSDNNNVKIIDAATFNINTNESYQLHTWYSVSAQFLGFSEISNIVLEMEEGSLFIDDVEIIDMTDELICPSEWLIENVNYYYTTIRKASNSIRAGYDVGAATNNGAVTVIDGGEVSFKAGYEISLEDSFGVEEGGEFHAFIAPCNSNCNFPFANLGDDFNINCTQECFQLGTVPFYGFTYSWFAQPATAIQFLSATNISNPLFCPVGEDYGKIK